MNPWKQEQANTARRRRRKSEAGIVFLDLMVGAALLAVALMAAAQLVLDTNNLQQTVAIKRMVSDAVLDEVKRVEITPFDNVVANHHGRGFAVAEVGGVALQALPGDPDGLPGSIQVDPPPAPATADELLLVTVRVDWQDRSGAREMERTMLLSRLGGASP